jgi:hypothetical protein
VTMGVTRQTQQRCQSIATEGLFLFPNIWWQAKLEHARLAVETELDLMLRYRQEANRDLESRRR